MDIAAKRNRKDYVHLIPELQKWLGVDGLEFFKKVYFEHGTLNAVWIEDGFPHSIHFREGMQVRNKLRELTNHTWSVYEYDNTWMDIIEECIEC